MEKAKEIMQRIEKAWEYEGMRSERERLKRLLKKNGFNEREIKDYFKKINNHRKDD